MKHPKPKDNEYTEKLRRLAIGVAKFFYGDPKYGSKLDCIFSGFDYVGHYSKYSRFPNEKELHKFTVSGRREYVKNMQRNIQIGMAIVITIAVLIGYFLAQNS